MRYLTVRKFASESGYSEDAIRSKIHDDIWRLGEIWNTAADGQTLIDVVEYKKWVEAIGEFGRSLIRASRSFMYQGVGCRKRITLKPTTTNLKKPEQHKVAIEHAISIGHFDYSVIFPGSPRAAKCAPEASREAVNGFLTSWLEAKKKNIASSTFEGYRKMVELRLVPASGDTCWST